MRLRILDIKDAKLMYEWMIDSRINQWFQFDISNISVETATTFIKNNNSLGNTNKHYAVVDESDIYQGTISLKNIDEKNSNAEYAIVMRNDARGKGYSKFATEEILNIAFNKLNLHKVYLNVLSENKRAIRFYEKFGFTYEGEFKEHIFHKGSFKDLKWYKIIKEEYNERYNRS